MKKDKAPIINFFDKIIQDRVSLLVSIANIELIVCYGIRLNKTECWSLFDESSQDQTSINLDTLIVVHPSEKRREHELVDRINQLNTADLRLVPIVHNTDTVRNSKARGSRFFRSVLNDGRPIYCNPAFSQPDGNTFQGVPDFDTLWKHRSDLAASFLNGAQFYLTSSQYSSSLFMLHQATEHICSAIIQAAMGYTATTHNLSRLFSLTETISPDISRAFPRATDPDKELFELLSQGYIQARYDESFSISSKQANDLYNRVAILIKTIRSLYRG